MQMFDPPRFYLTRQHLLAGFLIFALAFLGATSGFAQDAPPIPPDASYLIEPGDVLVVSVWREPDLTSEVTVRPDGQVSLPLAGEVQAAGGTVEDLRKAVDARLREKYLPDPVVTVSVKAVTGSRIYVMGKVNRPGEFLLSRPIDVMQALALAGGSTPYANMNGIQILRRSGDTQVSLPFRYDEVMRGQRLHQNILLQSGDTVVVP
ncbi:MAG: polysaccharide biosynthesis/export family protein [Nevskiaceae bacterium]|jgi:polysaccharide export outer membrane protein|nr:polysaccharide biosynthesis/export family protein [Nevskiaceae bacterium]